MPGVFRLSDDHARDQGKDLQRVVVYLPASELEEAERQSIRLGRKSTQDYCEAILLREIEIERTRARVQRVEAQRGKLRGFQEVASDPEYLAELTGSRPVEVKVPTPTPAPAADREARAVVLRHAGLEPSDDAEFLACLASGRSPAEQSTEALLAALSAIEHEVEGSDHLDRKLAYALHKLAFESEVFASEGWTASALGGGAVGAIRRVQEAAERVLSGRDIRYRSATGDEGRDTGG